VKVPHSNFAEVTWMVFVDIRSVMVLATCHTATTGMLAVLAYTTMTSRDMAATGEERCQRCPKFARSLRYGSRLLQW
jgi:hypothetical protein